MEKSGFFTAIRRDGITVQYKNGKLVEEPKYFTLKPVDEEKLKKVMDEYLKELGRLD